MPGSENQLYGAVLQLCNVGYISILKKFSEFSLVLRVMERRSALVVGNEFVRDASLEQESVGLFRVHAEPSSFCPASPPACCRLAMLFQPKSIGVKEGMFAVSA